MLQTVVDPTNARLYDDFSRVTSQRPVGFFTRSLEENDVWLRTGGGTVGRDAAPPAYLYTGTNNIENNRRSTNRHYYQQVEKRLTAGLDWSMQNKFVHEAPRET